MAEGSRDTDRLETGCILSAAMKIMLRNQGREVELSGRRRVRELLAELGILPETVLVIRGRDLLTIDEVVAEGDVVELRPVISGGCS
jgi:sulfur carrier protein